MTSQNSFVNASLSSSNPAGAAAISTSAVRSRPRRLVSFMDDEDDTTVTKASSYTDSSIQPSTAGLSTTLSASDAGTMRSRGATPSPLSSRGASPLPMKHPSRGTEPSLRNRNEATSLGWNGSSKAGSSRGTTDFLDSPWSSLQNLASSVLGSDIGRNSANNSTKTHTRRKPSRSDVYIRSVPKTAWGPSAPSTPEIGTGTKEERQALVQAKKREALLLADCDPVMSSSSRHKRRDSGDYFDQQPIDPDQEEEALAYIHPVAATDSITGVTIKYGCQAAIFRKANGFWPNDNIQSRKTVLLPVDACSVKGRPIRTTTNVDLLTNDNEYPSDGSIAPSTAAASQATKATDSNPPDSSDTDRNQIWKHESWVQIDGFPALIEIGRVSRRSLGFFPRTRRKSLLYSDSEPFSDFSRDLTRTPSPAGSPQLGSSQGVLPRIRNTKDQSRPGGANPTRSHRRQRSSIHLTGSGTGVGSLDRSSTAPGPAMDGLSKFFSQHMPYLAPPAPPQNQRRTSFGSESTVTSNTSGLENIGGALEGWVRKVAARTKAGINELQQGSPNQHIVDRGRSAGAWGAGDLIEMDDTSDGRRSPSLLGTRRPDPSTSSSSSFRPTASSASATSRSRTTGLGSGSTGYADRVKDD
ncbi:uncharacterized protein N7469_008937 [Penicillium citrinum]|uniref:LysM domain-containing protein n=1 Tax=Penicillium citrinum TaxID=5077 RepID=A0A9W9NMF5_PENCI|nr:uncharacterized protein N7469_008937 [Penicillium citrinum]KAJ5222697.1 hypothetical protein N7469_008937 [Penicillium citrinum]